MSANAFFLRPLVGRCLLLISLLWGWPAGAVNTPASDALAQLRLGEQYASGNAGQADHRKAVEWFRMSAEQGNAEAQFKLAWMLEKGMGARKDEVEALIWYQKAAVQGHDIAANNLGGLYADGRGVQVNPQIAFQWYERAAQLGLGHGHYNVAIAYRDGFGVAQDLRLARTHFQIAQNAGVAEATAKIADLDRRLAHAETASLVPCQETPQKYLRHMFGALLHSLDVGCMRIMTEREQTFTAGMSQYFVEQCSQPTDLQKRGRLIRFLTASGVVAATGRQFSNPNLTEMMKDQTESATLYAMGTEAAQEIGCNSISERLARHIVAYLEQSALGEPDKPGYVQGCVARYSGQYSRSQCECLASIGRSVFPDIHSQAFSSASIEAIIAGNPMLGFQIMLQCGIVDY